MADIVSNINDKVSYRLIYPSNTHRGEVAIVKIDDATLDGLSRSDLKMLALDKGTYAQVITNLFEDYGARVVGVDVVFSNASVHGQIDELVLADTLKKYKDSVVIASRSDADPHPLCVYSEAQHGAIDMPDSERIRYFKTQYSQASSYCNRVHGAKHVFAKQVLDLYSSQDSQKENIQENMNRFYSGAMDSYFIEYFYNPQESSKDIFGYESYSFLDILQKKSGINLQDKIVLIGEVGTLIHDRHFTPAIGNTRMSGVEIQANIINTLREGEPLRRVPISALIIISILLQGIMIFGVFHFKPIWSIFLLLVLLFVCAVLGGMFFTQHFIFDSFSVGVSIILSTIGLYIYRFQISDRSKRLLKKQFGLYVAPEVVEQMSQSTNPLSLKGEKREITIMFSDIEGFTGISENLTPEKLVTLLNEYFSEMTAILLARTGTLDKYIGDAIMCFFNAPLPLSHHSKEACYTALEQQSRLKKLNETWKKEGYPPIRARIGIHTGPAMHGNIGSIDTRLSYTVMGDSVNLASRLEGIGKYYGVYTVASEDVYNVEKENFHFRELDMIQVKGRVKPVRIFELIGPKSCNLPDKLKNILDNYSRALKLYREENFREAGKIFLSQASDAASKNMALRCRQLLDGKATILQGVFEMTSK